MQDCNWTRGELVIRGTEFGFVKADMESEDGFLLVQWRGGVEEIPRNRLNEVRRQTAEEDTLVRDAGLIPLESLERIEGLDSIQRVSAERSATIRSQREQRYVDALIRRGCAQVPECDWDKRNAVMLVVLALHPVEVGWIFKLQELLHRPIHALFHRR